LQPRSLRPLSYSVAQSVVTMDSFHGGRRRILNGAKEEGQIESEMHSSQ